MSAQVDERILEMRFDNQQFEKNVSTSMSTLEKLKKSLNMKGAGDAFKKIDSASNKCNFSAMGSALDGVKMKFSALQVMGITTLANLTNSAINAGKRMASALTIDPIKTGFQEYETQINAIQTILANTQHEGTNLQQVNRALDELNTYADKTIYNFTEMTRNIGTFTAAGVNLQTSVDSIKGIANLAAISGSTSQQASTAMYQLSQALAAGRISLMDWNSVVNAGMGGKVFQDALIRTSELLKTGAKDAIEAQGSFRESLTKGQWLTTEVLTETLKQFAGAYSEADLISQGFTKEQAKEISEMAVTAENAATKVKTFTQLWDTLKESAQSGWTQSWEIIVGDFEEAKQLLTGVSDVISNMLNESANARNEVLQGWKDLGGRTTVIDSVRNLFSSVLSITKPIKEAFNDVFPPATAEQLKNITDAIKRFTQSLILGENNANNLKNTFRGIFSVFKMGLSFVTAMAKGFKSLIIAISPLGSGLLSITGAIGDFITNLVEGISGVNSFKDVLTGLLDIVKTIASKIGSSMKSVAESIGNFNIFDSGIFKGIDTIASGLGKALSKIKELVSDVINSLASKGGMSLLNGGLFAGLLLGLNKLTKGLGKLPNSLNDFIDSIKEGFKFENITKLLDGVKDSLSDFQSKLKAETLIRIAAAIGVLALSLKVLSSIEPESMVTALGGMTAALIEMVAAMDVIQGIGGAKRLKGVMPLITIATALLVLSSALKKLSSIDSKSMITAIGGMTVALIEMVAAMDVIQGIDGKKLKGLKPLITMSASLYIVASALTKLSAINWKQMVVALGAMTVALGTMTVSMAILNKVSGGEKLRGAASLITVSTSLVIVASALTKLSAINWKQMTVALGAMTVALGAMTASIAILNKVSGGEKLRGATSLIAISASLVIVASALTKLSAINWKQMAVALGTMTVALGEMVGVMVILQSTSGGVGSAISIIGFVTATLVLAKALTSLSKLSISGITKGLIAMAGAFTVIGVAAGLLSPLAGPIIVLSGAIALLGAGCLAAGTGVLALAAGLAALGAAFAVDGAGIASAITTLLDLIPLFITKVVDGLVESIPTIVDGVGQLLFGVFNSLVQYGPMIIESLAEFLINTINSLTTYVPQFIKAFSNLFKAIFSGLAGELAGAGMENIFKSIAALGIMSGLMAALSAIAGLIPMAMVGVLGIGAVLAEFSLVLAALGGLEQIPGLDWLMGEGGKLLTKIGEIIGSFLGSIAGNLMGGISSHFAQLGSDLSAFMNNLKGFIDGAGKIDSNVFDGIKNLAKAFILITGASFIEGISKYITKKDSISRFSESIEPMADAITNFGKKIESITPDTISKIKMASEAGKALAEFASAVPNTGGLVSLFTGDNDLNGFSEGLVKFAESLNNLSTTDINEDTISKIKKIAEAGKSLTEFASIVPNSGGLVSLFTGDNDLTRLSYDLTAFATSLSNLSTIDINDDTIAKINKLSEAGKTLVSFSSIIPETGGLKTIFSGDNSLTSFATGVKNFGMALIDFSSEISGIDDNAVTKIKTIANLGQNLAWFAQTVASIDINGTNLTGFSVGIGEFGRALNTFSLETSNIDNSMVERIKKFANLGQNLAWFAQTVASINIDGTNLNSFSTGIKEFGKALFAFSSSTESINIENVANKINTIVPAIKSMNFSGVSFESLGDIGDGIKKLGGALKNYSTDMKGVSVDNSKLTGIASSLNIFSMAVSSSNIEESAIKVQNISKAVNSLDFKNISAENLSNISTQIDSLATAVSDFSAKLSGISEESLSAPIEAINTALGSISNIDTSGIQAVCAALASSGINSLVNQAANFTAAGTTLGNAVATGITNATATLNASGTNAALVFINGIGARQSVAATAGTSLGQAAASGASASASGFAAVGSHMAAGLAAGIRAGQSSAISAAIALARNALNAARAELDINSPSKKFIELGNYVGEGFSKGIQNGKEGAESSALILAKATETIVQKELDIHSPSRAFEAFGKYIGEGLAKGIKESADTAVSASSEMTKRVATVAKKSFDKIEEYIQDRKNFDDITTVEELAIWEAFIKSGKGTLEEKARANKEAYGLWKQYYDDLKKDAEESYQRSMDWLEAEEFYGRLTTEAKLAGYNRMLERNNNGEEHYTAENLETLLRNIYTAKKELANESYQYSMDWIENEKFYDRLTLDAELEGYERMLKRFMDGEEHYTAEQYTELLKKVYTTQKAQDDNLYQNRLDWIEEETYYGRMSLQEQLDAQKQILRDFGNNAERRKKAEREIYDLEKEIAQNRKDYADEYTSIQQEAADKQLELEKDYQSDRERILEEANEKRKDLEDNYYQKCQDVRDKLEDDIKSLNDEYDNAFKSRADSLYSAYGLFDKVDEKEDVNGSDLIKNLQDQIDEFDNWQINLNSLEAKGVNSDLIDELREMGVKSVKEIETLNNLSEPELTDYVQLWNEKHRKITDQTTKELQSLRADTDAQISSLRIQADNELEDLRADWEYQLYELDNDTDSQLRDLRNTFNKNMAELKASTNSKLEELNKSFKEKMGVLTNNTEEAVTEMSKEVTETIDNMSNTAVFSVEKMTNEAAEAIESKDWESVGSNIVKGMNRGIDNEAPTFLQRLIDLATTALNAINEALDIHSPSKKFMKVGRYIDEGLIVGIDMYRKKVAKVTENVGEESFNVFSETISKIKDIANGDIDMTPTIRPVLDLTDFSLEMNNIGNALNAERSISLGLDIKKDSEFKDSVILADLTSKWQKSNEAGNAKIADAIDGLKEDIASLAGTMRNMKVVMDTGTLVGAISPEMDRSLGRLSAYKKRGI